MRFFTTMLISLAGKCKKRTKERKNTEKGGRNEKKGRLKAQKRGKTVYANVASCAGNVMTPWLLWRDVTIAMTSCMLLH